MRKLVRLAAVPAMVALVVTLAACGHKVDDGAASNGAGQPTTPVTASATPSATPSAAPYGVFGRLQADLTGDAVMIPVAQLDATIPLSTAKVDAGTKAFPLGSPGDSKGTSTVAELVDGGYLGWKATVVALRACDAASGSAADCPGSLLGYDSPYKGAAIVMQPDGSRWQVTDAAFNDCHDPASDDCKTFTSKMNAALGDRDTLLIAVVDGGVDGQFTLSHDASRVVIASRVHV